jgi:hypothetical protein
MKSAILLTLLLGSPASFAQVAGASFFGTMKSVNPAVINHRPNGHAAVKMGKEKVEKYQLIDESVNLEGKTDIAVDSKSAFYGGKGGGFLTNEFSYFSSAGTRKQEVTETGAPPVSITNDIDFSQTKLASGVFGYFGVSLVKQSYKFHEKFSFTFDGNDFFEDEKIDIDETIMAIGTSIPLGNFDFGVFYESSAQDKDTEEFIVIEGYSEKTEKLSSKLMGLGVGYSTSALHFELSYESKLSSDQGDKGAKRISVTAEAKWRQLTFGYTGQSYRSGFKDSNSLVFNQLVYPDEGGADRLVNTFNFSFSPPKGISFGGSVSKTESTEKEVNPLVHDSFGEVDTKVETLSYAASLSYSW